MGQDGLRYVVFSEANCEDLREGIASLWEAWTRLRRSVCWKRKVKGCIVALEVTYNRKKQTWHPHLNVLMQGEYFPFAELNLAWREATHHCGSTSHISAANEGTVFELIKYVTKVSDLLDDAEALDEFLGASHGRRLIRTYGSFRGLHFTDEDNPQTLGKCPDCGPNHAVAIVQLGYVKPQQLSFDFEKGVFRVARAPSEVARALQEAGEFLPDFLPLPGHPRPRTVLEKELRRLNALISSVAATSRQGAVEWQQPQ